MIDTSLLIAAAMLQDYLVDKDSGLPLANGTITLYQDNARTVLKNWYYQSGSPGAYTYITLPNPLTLDGVGTIADPNGNDTIPFYYPYSELDNVTPQAYYIVVKNSNGEVQFTRQNFPFNPSGGHSTTGESILSNQICNGRFWRNIGSATLTAVTTTMPVVIAPDQHDGLSMPDIQFFKDVAGATDTVTFKKFLPGQFLSPMSVDPQSLPVTPEYYCNMQCTAPGSETFKYIQIPISLHVKTLDSAPGFFTIWARCNSGASSLTISVYQFLGTGVVSPGAAVITTLALNAAWQQFQIAFTFPLASNLVGEGGDDAFYLQIGYPTSVIFNTDIALPSIYIGDAAPINEFETYSQIDTIIDGPRTGDVRTSFNYGGSASTVQYANYVLLDWLLMNDGTIGNTMSGATYANQQAWQLYSLLWNSISDTYCTVIATDGSYPGRGVSAYQDFVNNNQLFLPKALGRVMAGADPTGVNFSKVFSAIGGTTALNVNDATPFYTGTQVEFSTVGTGTLPGGLSPSTPYYLIYVSPTVLNVATSYSNAINDIPITFSSSSTPTVLLVATLPAHAFGSYVGEDTHSPVVTEMFGHAHPGSTVPTNTAQTFTTPVAVVSTGTAPLNTVPVNVAAQGGNVAHNTIQPTVYANYLIKL